MLVAPDALGRLHRDLLNHRLVLPVHRHRLDKRLHRQIVVAADHGPLPAGLAEELQDAVDDEVVRPVSARMTVLGKNSVSIAWSAQISSFSLRRPMNM